MEGFLPERDDLQWIFRVLDIGCGPGGWALGVAKQYPHMRVFGIDKSTLMIKYAQAQAHREDTRNAIFEEMDALEQLKFPDSSFDLVNMRAAGAWIPRSRWSSMLKECYRVTRPGGYIRLTEYGPAETNSIVVDHVMKLISQLLKKRRFGFSPDGSNFGLSPMLGKFLEKAGCKGIQYKLYAVDFSHGTLLHPVQFQNLLVAFTQIKPLLMEEQMITEIEWNRVDAVMQEEMKNTEFRGLQYWCTCWGEKVKEVN